MAVALWMATTVGLSLSPAGATVGTGVSAAPIRPATALRPGATVVLPGWWVQNTGTEPADYHLSVVPGRPGSRELPPAWVELPPSVRLAPGQHATVNAQLRIPRAARPGDYRAYLLASATTAAPGGATTVAGAAAATDLAVEVADPGRPIATPLRVGLLAGASGVMAARRILRRRAKPFLRRHRP